MSAPLRHFGATWNHRWRGVRVAVRTAAVLLSVLMVTYPRPDLLVRHVDRWRNLNALIDPAAPGLDPLAASLSASISEDPDPRAVLAAAERIVCDRLPYDWDWNVWGVADFVPTVEEALDAGREDCDGRAVVAASLLRRFGYDARVVSDLGHVWVWTPQGQTMSPTADANRGVALNTAEGGLRVDWGAILGPASLTGEWPLRAGYAVAVFPLWREAVVIVVLWCAVIARRPRRRAAWGGLALVVMGWLILRTGCAEYKESQPSVAWAGWLSVLAGVVVSGRATPICGGSHSDSESESDAVSTGVRQE